LTVGGGPDAVDAVVRGVRATAAGRIADLVLTNVPVCPRCAEGRGCGAGLFGRRNRAGVVSLPVPPTLELRPGQPVSLRLREQTLLGAALLVYGQPLAGAAIASGAAWLAGFGDPAAVLAALAGLVAGIATARRRLRASQRAGSTMLRIDA
jgi:sigma-E factor negative regulatory protein RseC